MNIKQPEKNNPIRLDFFEIIEMGPYKDQVKTNFTIVRGLDYYDGFIIETNLNYKVTNLKGKEVDIGSICSGGAYAKLISRFKGVDIPGTGISFGVDRILFAMMQLDQITIDQQALASLQAFNWTGNVRQLKNAIERVLIMMDDNELNLITYDMLP